MKVKNLLAPILLSSSSIVMGATVDGTLGADSTGTVDVDISVSAVVQVSNLDTISLPNWTSGDASGFDDFCIYTNSSNNPTITFTSLNGTNPDFTLDSGSDSFNYAVQLISHASGADDQDPVQGGASYQVSEEDNTDTDCSGGGDTHRVQVDIPESTLSGASPGSYSDTLTIVVEAN